MDYNTTRSSSTTARYLKQHPYCGNCGGPATEVHHIVPLSLNGNDIDTNLISLCNECHMAIHTCTALSLSNLIKNSHTVKTCKKLGRPAYELPLNWEEVTTQWSAGKITAVEAMKQLKMTKSTFYKQIKIHGIFKQEEKNES